MPRILLVKRIIKLKILITSKINYLFVHEIYNMLVMYKT